jgi:hypothetical protein
MNFVPITIKEFVRVHVKNNPTVSADELREGLRYALAAKKAGQTCDCGAPIWVLGSAIVGLSCFSCTMGESFPDGDYEIDQARELP